MVYRFIMPSSWTWQIQLELTWKRKKKMVVINWFSFDELASAFTCIVFHRTDLELLTFALDKNLEFNKGKAMEKFQRHLEFNLLKNSAKKRFCDESSLSGCYKYPWIPYKILKFRSSIFLTCLITLEVQNFSNK